MILRKTVLIITASILIFSFGCNTTGGGDPKAVLKSFIDALRKKDITAAQKYATKDSESMLNMMEMAMGMAPAASNQDKIFSNLNIELGDAKIDGNFATIPVKEQNSKEETNFTLKKEDGNWKVAFDMNTMMQMAQKKMKEKGMNLNNMMDSINTITNKMGNSDMPVPDTNINGSMRRGHMNNSDTIK